MTTGGLIPEDRQYESRPRALRRVIETGSTLAWLSSAAAAVSTMFWLRGAPQVPSLSTGQVIGIDDHGLHFVRLWQVLVFNTFFVWGFAIFTLCFAADRILFGYDEIEHRYFPRILADLVLVVFGAFGIALVYQFLSSGGLCPLRPVRGFA